MKDVNVVVGLPIVHSLKELYGDEKIDLFTNERFLPKILVEIGFFKSNSEVRKNRPDLFIELNGLDFVHIKVGKNHLWLTIGEKRENKGEELVLEALVNNNIAECKWCEELFEKSELMETKVGEICCSCKKAIESRGESI